MRADFSYVSALQFGGKPQTLLDMAQDGRVELALSDEILCGAAGRAPRKLSS